jgi:CheY-like chemotaxis protein
MKMQPVLYVEDEENDVVLLRHAWKRAGLSNPLEIVQDGEEALDYLGGRGRYADREKYPMPCLVLLDLKLPKVPGLEVLKWIREQPSFHTLQVVVLSSSNHPADIHNAHALRANAFLTKPPNTQGLEEMAGDLADFWFKQAQTPPECLQFKDNGN